MTESEARAGSRYHGPSPSRRPGASGSDSTSTAGRTASGPEKSPAHDPDAEPKAFDRFCPVRNVSAQYPPTLLIHGTNDTDVPHEQSVLMDRELTRRGVPHEFISVPGGWPRTERRGQGQWSMESISASWPSSGATWIDRLIAPRCSKRSFGLPAAPFHRAVDYRNRGRSIHLLTPPRGHGKRNSRSRRGSLGPIAAVYRFCYLRMATVRHLASGTVPEAAYRSQDADLGCPHPDNPSKPTQ